MVAAEAGGTWAVPQLWPWLCTVLCLGSGQFQLCQSRCGSVPTSRQMSHLLCGQHQPLPTRETVPATSSILSAGTLWCFPVTTPCVWPISLQTSCSLCEPRWLYTQQAAVERKHLRVKKHHLSLLLNCPPENAIHI